VALGIDQHISGKKKKVFNFLGELLNKMVIAAYRGVSVNLMLILVASGIMVLW
jgi:hypothetical protein